MRLKITLGRKNKIILPKGFNEAIQGIIYRLINDTWLHNEGFQFDNRKFKMFVFSEILQRGYFNKKKGVFLFPPKISILISSPIDWILEDLATNAIFSKILKLGDNDVILEEIAVLPSPSIKHYKIVVKTLSPIEVHSTFEKDGKKKTHYYSAFDKEFSTLVNENLKRKWSSLYKQDCPFDIEIKPKGKNRERIVYFGMGKKYVIIKGWTGYFSLSADPKFLHFALDAGLGSRNSQGFGMVEMVE